MKSLIAKYRLHDSSWTYKGFHGVLHTFFPVGQTGVSMRDVFGDASRITLFVVKDNYVHWFWNDADLTRIRHLFLRRLRQNPNTLSLYRHRWRRQLRTFAGTMGRIDRTDLTALSDDQLAELYDRFYQSYLAEFKYFMMLGDAVSMHADRYLVPTFRRALGSAFDDVFPRLMATTHRSFVEREAVDRAELVARFRRTGTVPESLLERHAQRYFYLRNNYAVGERLRSRQVLSMVRRDASMPVAATPARPKAIRVRLSSWHRTLVRMMGAFFEIQDTRKQYVLKSNFYQFAFLREAARRTRLPFPLLQYSVYPEFRDVLRLAIRPSVLRARRQGCVCIMTERGHEIVTGAPAATVLRLLRRQPIRPSTLLGMVASRGRASGRVKVILKAHDLVNVDQGDVIVTSMTRPEMVPAMHLASAIVTDEGGITSHAAIVSRELGIPCIIGTKYATQVFHDGDLVEVDAFKGVVRKV